MRKVELRAGKFLYTQGQWYKVANCFRFFGRLNNILFGRPQANRPRSRPQLANQLAADGATGLSANQVGVVDGIRDVADAADIDGAVDVEDGFRQFGSTGECRHNFHCQGAERCVKKNGMFM